MHYTSGQEKSITSKSIGLYQLPAHSLSIKLTNGYAAVLILI